MQKNNLGQQIKAKVIGAAVLAVAVMVVGMGRAPINEMVGVTPVMAAESLVGELEAPVNIKLGENTLDETTSPDQVVADVITWLLNVAFSLAVIIALAMLIFGAYQWITSGGKSDKIAAGRNRMIWAIIGLVMVAAAFGITQTVKQILTGNSDITVDLVPEAQQQIGPQRDYNINPNWQNNLPLP